MVLHDGLLYKILNGFIVIPLNCLMHDVTLRGHHKSTVRNYSSLAILTMAVYQLDLPILISSTTKPIQRRVECNTLNQYLMSNHAIQLVSANNLAKFISKLLGSTQVQISRPSSQLAAGRFRQLLEKILRSICQSPIYLISLIIVFFLQGIQWCWVSFKSMTLAL